MGGPCADLAGPCTHVRKLGKAVAVQNSLPEEFYGKFQRCWKIIGRTPKGAYSSRGHSRHFLATAFSEPLLRTLLRTLFYCKTPSRPPSENPSENPFPRTLPRTFSEPFLERCVAVQPLRRAPKIIHRFSGSTRCFPCQGLGTFRQGNGCWKIGPGFRNDPGFSPLRPPQPS